LLVTAYDRHDGSVAWQRVADERLPHEGHHLESGWAAASPVTDGERVYAHFGSAGTFAYTLEGERVWKVDLGDMTTRLGYGEGSSPALWGDTLVVNWDHEGASFVVALDKRTGGILYLASGKRDDPRNAGRRPARRPRRSRRHESGALDAGPGHALRVEPAPLPRAALLLQARPELPDPPPGGSTCSAGRGRRWSSSPGPR
jgi:hypothetical protein